VLSVDGKGIVMRREDLRPSTQKRALADSQKIGKTVDQRRKAHTTVI
jgi:hypothetical protein